MEVWRSHFLSGKEQNTPVLWLKSSTQCLFFFLRGFLLFLCSVTYPVDRFQCPSCHLESFSLPRLLRLSPLGSLCPLSQAGGWPAAPRALVALEHPGLVLLQAGRRKKVAGTPGEVLLRSWGEVPGRLVCCYLILANKHKKPSQITSPSISLQLHQTIRLLPQLLKARLTCD